MRVTSLCFALTLALLVASAHANSSDENKYICFDPTKFQASSSFRVALTSEIAMNPLKDRQHLCKESLQGQAAGHSFFALRLCAPRTIQWIEG